MRISLEPKSLEPNIHICMYTYIHIQILFIQIHVHIYIYRYAYIQIHVHILFAIRAAVIRHRRQFACFVLGAAVIRHRRLLYFFRCGHPVHSLYRSRSQAEGFASYLDRAYQTILNGEQYSWQTIRCWDHTLVVYMISDMVGYAMHIRMAQGRKMSALHHTWTELYKIQIIPIAKNTRAVSAVLVIRLCC